jgi:ATP-dependent helicase/DNAse subunit B
MEQCTELCTGTLSTAEYVNYLTLAMDGTKVGGIPGYIDQVQLLPANQLEGYEAKTVIILNANEGVFPKKQDTDVFFTRREMALLPEYGLDMLSEGQAYDCEGMREFYQASALAKEKLFDLYDSEYPPSVGVNMLARLLLRFRRSRSSLRCLSSGSIVIILIATQNNNQRQNTTYSH